jgi:antiphage defense system Thoeris ThsB-like protein
MVNVARRVFFGFHYDRDIQRVGLIRNSGVVLGRGDTSCGLVDSAEWDSIRRGGDGAILQWIDGQLRGTSVTVVLIGAETANRQWINYEIVESVRRGNGLLGVYIHNVRDSNGFTTAKGDNPFDYVTWRNTGARLSKEYATYDWVRNDGHRNLSRWIEAAAKQAGR